MGRRRGIASLALLLLALATVAAAGVLLRPPVAVPASASIQTPSEPEPGRSFYLRDCAWCHGSDGSGTSRGSSLLETGVAGAYYMLGTGRMPLDEPTTELRRSEPAYDPEEMAHLIDYVASLGEGPGLPDVSAERGDLSEGEYLYRVHCAACHGPAGTGAALTAGRVSPPLDSATPEEVGAVLVMGPGPMPVFHPGTLDEGEMDSIAAYVTYLADVSDRGGFGLGNFGPVTEGLASWVLGVIPVIALMLLIGRRHR